jgi:GDP-4-dehydro-6-deoxy-D-mannose reductase
VRVLITGASGFVGTWLSRELESAGHDVINADPGLDVRDSEPVAALVGKARPSAIAHLAAVSFGPDASADPSTAYAVAIGGTLNVLEAARGLSEPPVILVTGSSEVYGSPRPEDLPLTESARLRPTKPYAYSKAAQESLALAYATRFDLNVVVTRSFNHVGPGQRAEFVVPALASRVAAMASGKTDRIPVGNVDVRRDLTDVRDVVRAYRMLLELATSDPLDGGPLVVNVCSGESVTIRWVAEELCRLAEIEPKLAVDPALVRQSDPPDIRGDYSLLNRLTSWRPAIPVAQTLRDIWMTVMAI